MGSAAWGGSALALLAAVLCAGAWWDACAGEPDFRQQFRRRFRRGAVIGALLSVVGGLLAYASTYMGQAPASVSPAQFIVSALACSVLAILGVGVLNGLNPSPVHARIGLLSRFIVLGWVVAIPLLFFVVIYLPITGIGRLFAGD